MMWHICWCSQKRFGIALLDRYRDALETAVQISCRYNVPPLPGRTVILISDDIYDNYNCVKQDFCLPPYLDDDDEEDETQRRRRDRTEEDDHLSPSVRCWFLFRLCHRRGLLVILISLSLSLLDHGNCSTAFSDDWERCWGRSALQESL